MTSTPPADHPNQEQQAAAPVGGADEFAAKMHAFWEKNRIFVLILCAAVLVGILAREGWGYLNAQREQRVQEEYAKIADKTDKLAAFASANQGHALAGVALLRLADDVYTKGDFKQAAANYQKAAGELTNDALKGRAQVGAAMSQLAAGDKAAAEAALKALSADANAAATARAEATYHRAALAHEAGKMDEAKKLLDEVSKLEATGLWAQRALMLRAKLEAAAPAAPSSSTPAVQFKPGGE